MTAEHAARAVHPGAPDPLAELAPHVGAPEGSRGPRPADALLRGMRRIDGVMDALYGAPWNPLYRSGTWAVSLFLIACVTGVWLLLFYRVGAPYASVLQMTERPLLVGWVRSVHRYASDAAVVATAVHVVRLFAEGKTWGPRVLAWITGLLLLAVVLIVGFSGFILAWDTQGQAIAVAGARFMQVLPFLYRDLGGALEGLEPPPTSFFFVNLFLHLALPLGMIGMLWLHTLRLARAKWLPPWRVTVALTALLTALAVAMPAPLSSAPDPYANGQPVVADLFYAGWLALFAWADARVVWGALTLAALVLLAAPVYWRPRRTAEPPKSVHDEAHCEGCGQCVKDCPFEAIEMVPRSVGHGSDLVANVRANLCTSCGLCAGSCSQLAIGPPDRQGHVQLRLVKEIRTAAPAGGVVLMHCVNGAWGSLEAELRARATHVVPYAVECAGIIHPTGVKQLLKHFRGVMIVACPPEACRMREGAGTAEARLLAGQSPSTLGAEDAVRVLHVSPRERAKLLREFHAFATSVGVGKGSEPPAPSRGRGWGQHTLAAALVTLALLGLGAGNRIVLGAAKETALLRVAWRIPSPKVERCRPPTADERRRIPAHLSAPDLCERTAVAYTLRVVLDGETRVEKAVAPAGSEANGPLLVDFEWPVSQGPHTLHIRFMPSREAPEDAPRVDKAFAFTAKNGRVSRLSFDAKQRAFLLR